MNLRILYDRIIAALFGVMVCVFPGVFLLLGVGPNATVILGLASAATCSSAFFYRLIKKNRAERRFFLDEPE